MKNMVPFFPKFPLQKCGKKGTLSKAPSSRNDLDLDPRDLSKNDGVLYTFPAPSPSQ